MQSSNLAPGETLVQCPYNKAHMILNHKLLTHFVKCRKQYEKEERAQGRSPSMLACRFNFLHKVPKPEIELHESSCPDMYSVIHTLIQDEKKVPTSDDTKSNRPEQSEDNFEDTEENWDAEHNAHGGYDPNIKLQSGNYLYVESGMTKSERKAAREANRAKWRESKEAVESSTTQQSFDWDENNY